MIRNPVVNRGIGYEDHGYYPLVLKLVESVSKDTLGRKRSVIWYVVHNKETGVDKSFVGTLDKNKAIVRLERAWREMQAKREINPVRRYLVSRGISKWY